MKKGTKIIIAVLAVLLLIFMFIIGSYNRIIGLDQSVNAASSNIDTQLQRRLDLIPNLVETVKGYASQEKAILNNVVTARAKLAGAQTITEKANADNELSSSLSRLLVIVENYPQLKSSQNFRDLSVALEGTENRIAIARQDYNSVVTSYNYTIKKFPNFIVAGMLGFKEKPYYKANNGAKDVPKVQFTR